MSGETPPTGAERICDALVDAGIETVIGLPGTQTLPLDREVVDRDGIEYVMARHETAIPHFAWGHYEVSGRMAATVTVPGPGDTNAMHGLKNALNDCVPMLHVAADTAPEDRGKEPIHEIESDTFDNVVKENLVVERSFDLPAAVDRAIAVATTTPTGPVRLGVPKRILKEPAGGPTADVSPETSAYDNEDAYAAAVSTLAGAERPIVCVGGGTRRSPDGVRAVRDAAEALSAPVVATLKGKGVFPEDHPQFLGVLGSHLPASARRVLAAADAGLALGTDFDGLTTDGWSIPMGDRLVHVNVAADEIGASYDADVAIVDDAATAADRIREGLAAADDRDSWDGGRVASAAREEYVDHLDDLGVLENGAPANTPGVLRAIREAIPRDAIVTTDVGGFRLWAKQTFETYSPETYVSAGSWAGMGVGLPAALGAKLARPDRSVVSLIGDGGLMMCLQEWHTAVEEDIDVVTVVFDNSDYGIISKSADEGDEYSFAWESPAFATIAEGFGCRATVARTKSEARAAVEDALAREEGPEVIVVDVETDEPSAKQASDYESDLDL